eukprot:353254-Amphidinium_carterae.2
MKNAHVYPHKNQDIVVDCRVVLQDQLPVPSDQSSTFSQSELMYPSPLGLPSKVEDDQPSSPESSSGGQRTVRGWGFCAGTSHCIVCMTLMPSTAQWMTRSAPVKRKLAS